MKRRRLFFGLLLLCAAGCAIGPGYQRPAVEAPAAWKASESSVNWKEASPNDAVPTGEWWVIFGDTELNELQTKALAANLDIQAAFARVTQARAVARQAVAGGLPSVEATPAYSHYQRTRSSFGGSGTFAGDTYQIPFDISYELDLWGRVRRGFEAAHAQAQASEAAYRTVLLSLRAEVARAYFLLRTFDSEMQTLEQAISLRRDALDLVTQRMQAGIVNELDVARAKTELASAEENAIDLRRRRAELENGLAVLCGEPASSFSLPVRPLLLEIPQVPAGLPSELLERRPDVAKAERELMAANARIGVAMAAFFPVVRLTGSGGFESAEIDSLFEQDSRTWSLGPSVSIPLFSGGRAKSNLQAAKAQFEEVAALYRQQVLVAFCEVEDALVNLRLRAEQAQTHQRALDSSRQAAELSSTRYKQGLVNYLEVVDAERSRLQAEREAVNLLSYRLVSTVLLIKALGGSWEPASAPTSSP